MIQKISFSVVDGGVEVEVISGMNAGRIATFPGITERQMIKGAADFAKGALIQRAFPFLSADQREFLMTGIYAEEWDEMWAEKEEI